MSEKIFDVTFSVSNKERNTAYMTHIQKSTNTKYAYIISYSYGVLVLACLIFIVTNTVSVYLKTTIIIMGICLLFITYIKQKLLIVLTKKYMQSASKKFDVTKRYKLIAHEEYLQIEGDGIEEKIYKNWVKEIIENELILFLINDIGNTIVIPIKNMSVDQVEFLRKFKT